MGLPTPGPSETAAGSLCWKLKLPNTSELWSKTLPVALGLLCFFYRYLSYRGFTNDHFVHVARARQMLLGDWPIRDYLEPGLPLQSGLSAIFQVMFGRSLIPEALLSFGGLAIAAALTCWLVGRLTGSYLLASAVTILQILILPRSYSFPKILVYPIAAVAIARYVRNPSASNIVILAAVTVASFLMRYDHGLYIAAGCTVGLSAVHWGNGWSRLTRAVTTYGAVAFIMVAPYLIYIQWAIGVPSYVRDTIAFNRAEAQRAPVQVPTLALAAFDAFGPMRREATIYVEWKAGIGDDERRALEDRLGLVPDTFVEGRTRRYRISDVERASIERIVTEPSIEDTGGIDRTSYRVDPDRFTGRCLSCVLPAMFRNGDAWFQDAQAWLYYLTWAVVIGGAAVVATRTSDAAPVVAAMTVMTALAGSTFLRDSLAVRLPDVWGLVPILLALVLTGGRRLGRWPPSLRLRSMVVVALTAAAIVPIGNVREEIGKTGLSGGPARIAQQFQDVSRELADAGKSRDARSIDAYLAACTAPTDRLLTFAFLPELFYLTDRGFAAGYATFVEGHHTGVIEQRRGIERWQAQSVPYAVAYELQVPVLAASFPLIGEELRRRYAPVHRRHTQDRRGALVVFAERNRPVESTYEPLNAPCFTKWHRSVPAGT